MEYRVIRGKRKSISLSVKEDGILEVRAPFFTSDAKIREIILLKQKWISRQLKRREADKKAMEAAGGAFSEKELKEMTKAAKKLIPERVAYYAPIVGVNYGRITIRHQKSRWGSCTAKGNLNFNCLLMLTPPEVIDAIVVHELCHRKQMNHSDKFYAEVYRVYPDYDRWNRWLKTQGSVLMRRLKG